MLARAGLQFTCKHTHMCESPAQPHTIKLISHEIMILFISLFSPILFFASQPASGPHRSRRLHTRSCTPQRFHPRVPGMFPSAVITHHSINHDGEALSRRCTGARTLFLFVSMIQPANPRSIMFAGSSAHQGFAAQPRRHAQQLHATPQGAHHS